MSFEKFEKQPEHNSGVMKTITITILIILGFSILFGLIRGIIVYEKTNDMTPILDVSLGKMLYWDNNMYNEITTLKDSNFISQVPNSIRETFKTFLIQQIIFNIFMFLAMGYLFFRIGVLIASEETSIFLILLIILIVVIPLTEFLYGFLVHHEMVIPYRGLFQLFKDSTWNIQTIQLPVTNVTVGG